MTRTIFAARSAAVAALVGLFLLVNSTPSQASDFGVEIHNDRTVDMTGFYASEAGAESWGEDRLGGFGYGIDMAHWVHFDLDVTYLDVSNDIDGNIAGCMFDFKAKFADGVERIRHGINVCETDTYHFLHYD